MAVSLWSSYSAILKPLDTLTLLQCSNAIWQKISAWLKQFTTGGGHSLALTALSVPSADLSGLSMLLVV